MTKRRPKGNRQNLPLKNEGKSIVAEEISFGEARKNLIKAEYPFCESKLAQQIHSELIIKDGDQSGPWYFTHI